ncbi:NAD(P)H-hydrate dehydratase, partial [bacterium]|nr:NAD(P)H-hydrate dehydratase [bacterium]
MPRIGHAIDLREQLPRNAERHRDGLERLPGRDDVGREQQVVLRVASQDHRPVVIDADALNAIAANQAHHLLQSRHVITPHPGEFARLAPESALRGREAGCDHFTAHNPSVLLLKGARTLVMQRGTDLYHNSTGHAGMASGGMGDVLSGVIGALLGQGMQPLAAACCGAWLCGRA